MKVTFCLVYKMVLNESPKFDQESTPLISENNSFSSISIDSYERKSFIHRHLFAIFAIVLLILLISFLFVIILVPILHRNTTLSNDDNTANPSATVLSTRLPSALKPVTYRLKFQPYFPSSVDYPSEKNFTFDGEVIIEFKCVAPTNNITLHSNGLKFIQESIRVNSMKGDKIEISNNGIRLNRVKHHLVIFLEKQLNSGETYAMSLKFSGLLRKDTSDSIFVSNYTENGKKKFMIGTQFEGFTNTTSFARNVFPCFDEPAYKAKFLVRLVHPSDLVALSNGEVLNRNVIGYGWSETEFSETPPMSTYLLAITIGDLVGKFTVSSTGTKIGIWTWPAMGNHTDLALSTARESLEFFGNYFDSPFPLPKADFVGLPVFKSEATEFWGIIIFSYEQLLFDANVQTTKEKTLVITTINHEIAHQWFGNLVTMAWWDDLFLAEGLAQYYQYIAAMEIFPEQSTFMYQYYVAYEQRSAFNAEYRPNAHPEHYKYGPDFGPLTYDKGAALVRMLNYTLGGEILKQGIIQYLKQYSFSTANYVQLFDILTKVAQEAGVRDWNGMPLNVTEMMEYWMNQPGFPIVSVKRNQNKTTATLANDRGFWFPTKLLYNNDGTLQSEWLFNSKVYDKDETSFYTDSYFIANGEGGAYATVEYDENSWQKLMEEIYKDPTILDSTTKAKLFVDLTYKGARSTDIQRFLDLSLTLINETSAKTWEVAIPVFEYINNMFRNHKNYWMIQKYLRQLIESVLNSEIKNDWNGGILVNKLLSLLLDVTNTDQLINLPHIKHYLNCYAKNRSNSACWLDPDLRPAIYCVRIRTKGSAQFDHTWLKLETEINRTHLPYFESEKEALLYGLSCTSSSTQLQKLLQYVVEHNESDVLKDIVRNSYGYLAMTTFFKSKPKRGDGTTVWRNKFSHVLATVSSTQEQLNNLQFLSNDRMIMKAVKTNIRWLNENENTVIGWLKNHVRFYNILL